MSLLWGNGTGIVCWNPGDPTAEPAAVIEGTWDGGTGRFETVEGIWSARFDVFEPVGMTTRFIAEAGVVEGTLFKKGNGGD